MLAGKTALIMGCSPNIGGGIAEVMAERGAAICCVDANSDYAEKCAAALIAAGGRAVPIVCDVTNPEMVDAAVAAATHAFDRIDIAVNNAAIFNKKGLLDMPPAEWRRQIDVILTGTFLATQACVKQMVQQGQGGSIVNIVSTAGHQGEPRNIAYSTAKAGLLNFTRSAAMELVRHRIRVNSLTPTATSPDDAIDRADRWGVTLPLPIGWEERFQRYSNRIPMRRLPAPRDYGKAAAFLASDDAAMITGEDLRVDAGAVAKYWAWDPSDDG